MPRTPALALRLNNKQKVTDYGTGLGGTREAASCDAMGAGERPNS
jgi:hypothetical protein